MRFEALAELASILLEKLVVVLQNRAEVLDCKICSEAVPVLVGVVGRRNHLSFLLINRDDKSFRQTIPVAPEVLDVPKSLQSPAFFNRSRKLGFFACSPRSWRIRASTSSTRP